MARILVVDDEPTARELARQALQAGGHEVVEAADGNSGMDLLRSGGFALVVMDVMMPGRGGVETLIEIHRDFRSVKVIVVSGKIDVDSDAFRTLAQHFGASRILRKPFAAADLVAAVNSLL